jgi:hypothetical protein
MDQSHDAELCFLHGNLLYLGTSFHPTVLCPNRRGRKERYVHTASPAVRPGRLQDFPIVDVQITGTRDPVFQNRTAGKD